MRILCVIGGYGDEHLGGEIHRELALETVARGHEYQIFATAHARHLQGPAPTRPGDRFGVERVLAAGRPLPDLVNALARPFLHFPTFVPALVGLVRFLRSRPPFAVIVAESAFPMGSVVELATRLVPQPFLVSVSGGDFIGNEEANYGYARFRRARTLMARAFARARLVRTVSPQAAEAVRDLGCPSEKLAIVQRNIGLSSFLPAGAERAAFRREAAGRLRARFGLAAAPVIATVGRLLPIKGFDPLVRALPAVRDRRAGTQLLLVGPNRRDERLGDYQVHLQGLAASLGLSSALTFTGPLPHEEIRDVLAGSDVVAIPSTEEGGNKMVMEAAAAGTPFVATSTSGTSAWARAFQCGREVEPGAPEELTRGLLAVLEAPAEAEAMGERGLRFAQAFRPEVVAGHMIALCRAAARGEAPPQAFRGGALVGGLPA